ncbi:nucleoside/nucleotide kinase family protein [Spongiactinospora sp. TRM90649]|uniref:nucleoside/nucleotide kinase family protein n=1 Tax=Spongiactinospora sp. TRM90649 TaxID=3031114 RepID=UPI0023F73D38|nr:nucleoside/nucleotide kinase family protein [Spongiactinospora sp. TRM90649]MDF5754542.1 nucleoside/nucleotide kinase family protein [Spongiactinospora sp. TRM90649]
MTTLPELAARARALAPDGRRAVLGITGCPGAGKSTLTEYLLRALRESAPRGWVAHVPMDGFHLADAELDRLGRRARKGAADTFDAAGYAVLLRRLREEHDDVVYAPAFERDLEQPIAGAVPVPRAARLVITEGNYLLLGEGDWARVRPCLNEVWYCDLDPDERLRRLVARHERYGKTHGEAVAWATGTDQRNADLIAATRHLADLVIPDAVLRAVPDGSRT